MSTPQTNAPQTGVPQTNAPHAISRVQLALNVTDLDAAVERYTEIFGVAPAKRRPGYANFALVDPPLKLVLFENSRAASPLNHLGVELPSPDDVRTTTERFAASGLPHNVSEADLCCHALQDKVWVDVPDAPLGAWEFYTVLDDDPAARPATSGGTCCATTEPGDGACC
jgi:catechol 2,3-dioxygenase-like lactoylglutathione lyase family enzyme